MAQSSTCEMISLYPSQPATPVSSSARLGSLSSSWASCSGMLLAALDQTVVGTAMPRIVAALGGTNITWVVTSYLLASTVTMPIIGKLSDIYGRRIFFMGGMVIFLHRLGALGHQPEYGAVGLYRGIQGLGAGALMPIALAIIGDIFQPAERGKWQGLFMARLWPFGHRGAAARRRHHR